MRILVLVFLLINLFIVVTCTFYKQERAKFTYWNPKYVSKPSIFTMRSRRGDHYKTNVTVEITQLAWNNNVTMKLSYKTSESAIDLNFVSKVCDAFKHDWSQKFLSKFTTVTWGCPVLPGTYVFTNIDFDKSVMPLPMPKGRNILSLLLYITRTKEPILEGSVTIFVH